MPYPKPQRKPTRPPVVPSPPLTPSSSTPSSTKQKVVQLMVESVHVSSSKLSVNPISTLLYTLASMPEKSLPLKSSPAPTLCLVQILSPLTTWISHMSKESAWNAFTNPHPSVPWSKVIWLKHAVPRWSLIQLMAVLGRLSTRDRLQKWGVIRDAQCVLCQQSTETHGHLLSQCAYSSQLWRSIQSSQNPCCPFDELSQVIGWMVQYGNGDQFSFFYLGV